MDGMGRILMVVTSNGALGDSGKPTGLWLSEFAGPYYVLSDAGYSIDVASPKGGPAPIDPRSMPKGGVQNPEEVNRWNHDEDAQRLLQSTAPLSQVQHDDYRGIVLVGGHGTMWDFPGNPYLSELLVELNNRGGVVGAICHGPAAFVGAHNPDGTSILHGRPVTCYSDAEEREAELAGTVPFLLQSKLAELGAVVQPAQPGQSKAVRDGNLVTAQNSHSVDDFCGELLVALQSQFPQQSAAGTV